MSHYTQNTCKQDITVSLLPDQIFNTTDTALCQSTVKDEGPVRRKHFSNSGATTFPSGSAAHATATDLLLPGPGTIHPNKPIYFQNIPSLTTRKSTNKIHHVKRIRGQKCILISDDRRKGLDKPQQPFMTLTPRARNRPPHDKRHP